MGLSVYPSEIRSFASKITSNSESLAEKLEKSMNAIEDFEEDKDLDGVAWKNTKQQLANHKYVIQGLIAAGDQMREDAAKLANSVGNEILNEDELNEKLWAQYDIKENAESNLHYYRNKNGTRLADGTVLYFGRIISSYSDILNTTISRIGKYEEKLERLREIENNTRGLFQGAINLFNAVKSVNTAVAGSWNGSGFTATAPEDAVAVIKKGWNQTRDIRILRRAGVTVEQYWHMQELGYSVSQIQALVSGCETEEDRQFLDALMDEDYVRAFAVQSGALSDGMSITMADYAQRLASISVVEDNCKKLQEFNNAIFQFETTKVGSVFKYTSCAEGYLLKLSSGSQELLDRNSAYILAYGLTDDLEKKSYMLMAMSSLWGSQYALVNGARFDVETNRNYAALNMDNLRYESGEHIFRFDLSYDVNLIYQDDSSGQYNLRLEEHRKGSWNIKANVLEHGDDLDRVELNDTINKLKEEKSRLGADCMANAIADAVIIGVAAWNPLAGMALGAAKTVIKEEWGNLDNDAVDIVKQTTDINKTALSSAQAIFDSMQKAGERASEIEEEKEKEKWEYWMNVFGSGGSYNIMMEDDEKIYLLYRGVYNPETLDNMRKWQKQGLAGLEEELIDDEQIKDIVREMVDHEVPDKVIQNAKILMSGGNIVGMDPQDFSMAAEEVDERVGDKLDNPGWSIKSYFSGESHDES